MDIRKSKVYTRGGDKGETSLVGGQRVPKTHIRIEAYGTADELMAHTAFLRDLIDEKELKEQLLVILDKIMVASSILATEIDPLPPGFPTLAEDDILFLESAIDKMDSSLPELNSFVLPGGSQASSQAHIARTVCRRAERMILKLSEESDIDELLIKYFNRLSDYYFLLSRYLLHLSGDDEIAWNA